MRIGTLMLVAWLVIGAVAAGQRHYFSAAVTGCSGAATVAETIAAGPLNYMGLDPRGSCRIPPPSR
jgi:hypothetical protein